MNTQTLYYVFDKVLAGIERTIRLAAKSIVLVSLIVPIVVVGILLFLAAGLVAAPAVFLAVLGGGLWLLCKPRR